MAFPACCRVTASHRRCCVDFDLARRILAGPPRAQEKIARCGNASRRDKETAPWIRAEACAGAAGARRSLAIVYGFWMPLGRGIVRRRSARLAVGALVLAARRAAGVPIEIGVRFFKVVDDFEVDALHLRQIDLLDVHQPAELGHRLWP